MTRRAFGCLGLTVAIAGCSDEPVTDAHAQGWALGESMRPVARRFTGRSGVVLHVGDSITLDPAYSAWPLSGRGRSAEDDAILKWMHAGTRGERDGWSLCSTLVAPKRSATAYAGIQLRQLLAGELSGISLAELLDRYQPQVVVFLLGTNDATARRPEADFSADLERAVTLMTVRGIVPVLTTLPPHARQLRLARGYNRRIHDLARMRQLPLIDFHGEIMRRRPTDWNGTLMERNDLHPTAGSLPAAQPTETDLAASGYLLRSWLSVRKLAEVKTAVFDAVSRQ